MLCQGDADVLERHDGEDLLAELDQQELLPVGKAVVQGKYLGQDIRVVTHGRNAGI